MISSWSEGLEKREWKREVKRERPLSKWMCVCVSKGVWIKKGIVFKHHSKGTLYCSVVALKDILKRTYQLCFCWKLIYFSTVSVHSSQSCCCHDNKITFFHRLWIGINNYLFAHVIICFPLLRLLCISINIYGTPFAVYTKYLGSHKGEMQLKAYFSG